MQNVKCKMKNEKLRDSKLSDFKFLILNSRRAGGFTPLHPASPGLQTGDKWQIKIRSSEKPCPLRRGVTGFTLLEIIVVVFILALLAAIVAPNIIGRSDDARIKATKVQIKNFETALKLFKLDSGFYPGTEQGLEALINKPTTGNIPNNYRENGYLEQKKIPLDPWGNAYVYVSPGIHGDFDIMSLGADGKEGGEGKDADIKNWDMQ